MDFKYWRSAQVFLMIFPLFSSVEASVAAEIERHKSTTENTYVMKLTGEIDLKTLYNIQYHLAAIPEAARNRLARTKIILSSKGGDLDQGIRIGRFFRNYRIRTIILAGEECSSACAIAFLGGTNEGSKTAVAYRTKSSAGLLGFHRFKLDYANLSTVTKKEIEQAVTRSQSTMLQLLDYFVEMDVDPRILRHMFNTPSSDMYYPDNAEALEYCIHIMDETLPPDKNIVSPYDFKYAVKSGNNGSWQSARCKY